VNLNDLIIVVGCGDGAITRLATAVSGLLANSMTEGVGDTSLGLGRELSGG